MSMYRVTIRVLGSEAAEPAATGTGATWEEAAFNGYDRITQPKGEPRRYLAYVESEPEPGRKIVRFGTRVPGSGRFHGDPLVAVDVCRAD